MRRVLIAEPREAGWFGLLFPDPPRRLPHARLANVLCRTVHLVAFGLLLGGHAWGIDADRLLPALWLTVGSGLGLMTLETAASGRWLLEVRGLVVVVKLGLLLLVPAFWEFRVPLLVAVVVIASVSSHMPSWFRHATLVPLPQPAPSVSSAPGSLELVGKGGRA